MSRACARALAEAGADGGRLVSQAGGYLLDVRPGERDVDRWQQALGRARRARADGEPRVAREGVEEALGVWRGQPLGGREHEQSARRRAREAGGGAPGRGHRGDRARPRAGPPRRAARASWRRWSSRIPSRSAWWSCRCWRSIAADGRPTRWPPSKPRARRFVDELGIEPAQPLRELHEDVLTHSAELSPPPDAPRRRSRRSRGRRRRAR